MAFIALSKLGKAVIKMILVCSLYLRIGWHKVSPGEFVLEYFAECFIVVDNQQGSFNLRDFQLCPP